MFHISTKSTHSIKICFTVTEDVLQLYTGELGYDRLNGTRKIGPSYAKSVICT